MDFFLFQLIEKAMLLRTPTTYLTKRTRHRQSHKRTRHIHSLKGFSILQRRLTDLFKFSCISYILYKDYWYFTIDFLLHYGYHTQES